MVNKFDTNPLDPEFPERSRAASNTVQAAFDGDYAKPQTAYETAEFRNTPPSVTEEETRRFAASDLNGFAYSGAVRSPQLFGTATAGLMNRADTHSVAKIGLPEKWVIALPYIPFYVGLIAGALLLLLVPKQESKVRFHAAQGLAAHVGILFVTAILGGLGNITGLAEVASLIFAIVSTIMLICFAFKAWSGKPVHIESVDDLTNWLEEKIGPVK